MELNADVLHVFKAFIQEISNAIIPQLFRQTILAILLSASFSSYALTKQTSNIIHGNAPYLTFDDDCIRTVDTNDLNGITLSDGVKYTPSTKISSTAPIVLPATG
ncbi:hypothetical protein J3T98_00560 [Gilliamella sp. B2772]|uniref:hypothetical protein n=1 Tax=Gilliamella sp. B2772 TaxID=2817981 RepID=UPI00226A4BD2|nr:hypothetical protein [Gilliamella sp. B2772]MCX8659447.1 hypothetical protein [Gilliamella sp. B2772]